MRKRDTKAEIAQACHDQVIATSLSSIRVGELIKTLGINRNTFYYHFAGKYEVVEWIFRRDLANALRQTVPESKLVYQQEGGADELFHDFPMYSRTEIAARTYDHSVWIKMFVKCALDDAPFYRKLFTISEPEFVLYAHNLWREPLSRDIDLILDGRYLPAETKGFLADNCSTIIVNSIIYCLAHPDDAYKMLDDDINPFWNAIPESLYAIIRKYPLNPKR